MFLKIYTLTNFLQKLSRYNPHFKGLYRTKFDTNSVYGTQPNLTCGIKNIFKGLHIPKNYTKLVLTVQKVKWVPDYIFYRFLKTYLPKRFHNIL